MKVCVIGYGSIGERHARILRELGCEVSVVSSRAGHGVEGFSTMHAAFENGHPDTVVVSNRTSEHFNTICDLDRLDYQGIVLVEKPVVCEDIDMPDTNFKGLYVAYNLRFHPVMRKLKDLLQGQKILLARAYVGSYLPNWRRSVDQGDYRKSYSAKISQGGGVIRDLSHELDYLNWLVGPWKSLTAIGGHFSHLEIDSDDLYSVMMKTERCPLVTVHMNYLDRVLRREVLIHTDEHSYKGDLVAGTLMVDDKLESLPFDRDLTYRLQHQAILDHQFNELCTLNEGIEVVRMIEAAERASREGIWVNK